MPSPPTTTSLSVTQTINGSHSFTIKGYSLAKGIGIGKHIASDTFTVGGYEWAIYFYPDGKNPEDNSAYVSVFIALASDGTDVRALFELSLLDQSGKGKHKVHSHFDRALESGPYTLKYRGSMCVLFSACLVSDESFPLRATPLWLFKVLCKDISVDSVANILALADRYNASALKSVCLKFAAENLIAVMRSDGFDYLREHCPSLQSELLKTVAGCEEELSGGGGGGGKTRSVWGQFSDGGADTNERSVRQQPQQHAWGEI
ncbi:hypothetical protein DY000_02043959 [Brassica cretica]|uniref:MATH domain-containing protein n=1 Tax=Brassica cretica TaxID=69181 RepID=A0ABQ7B9U7_BRACR|nr:hypothetical protein DY000_02043959 [Brassica cretica]